MNNSRITQLKKFIEEDPSDPFNVYALANEYISDEPRTALMYFEQLLLDHPDYLGTYYQAGKLYQLFDKTKKAKEVFELGILIAGKQSKLKTLSELRGALNEILDEEE